jgi:hypothetical protein
VYLWLEKYVLTICAAIAFGFVFLNPLKLDWQQRLSLFVAISAFAYFLAHTIHRPKASATVDSDQRIGFLQRQVEDLQAQQRQLAIQRADDAMEKQRRQTLRNHLAEFLKEGKNLQRDIEYNDPDSLRRKVVWEGRVVEYLTKNLDESYAVRFRSPSHQVSSYPNGVNMKMLTHWGDISAKMAMLNDFMSELRD